MTEKKFWDEVWERAGHGAHGHRLADFALKAAKEAGAKFDPEPVELPVLAVSCADQVMVPEGGRENYRWLTPLEAAEAVRRCNAWPRLRVLVMNGQYGGLLDILDGKR